MVRFELINYFDVWSGEEKGTWEVNNLCSEGFIELPENADDLTIIKALKEFGFLNKNVRRNMVELSDDSEFMIEIVQKRNQYPIGRLERRWHD